MGMKNPVYMDHNATTAVRPEARDAVALALALTGNPSSVHGSGRTARRLVEDARDAVAVNGNFDDAIHHRQDGGVLDGGAQYRRPLGQHPEGQIIGLGAAGGEDDPSRLGAD